MRISFRPIDIGNLSLKNNLIAAPIAGLSSLPYRLMAIEQGCALAFSEMVSAEGAIRAQARTKRYYSNDPRSRPFGVQLFGAEAQPISEAIRLLEGEPVDLIDINMGCPVKKVCSKGAGAALMCTPAKVAAIVSAARNATKRPLTAKIRSGWNDGSINCAQIARIAEDAGADAITLHPRTKRQEFRGKANWRHIADVKAAVKIPVIGNGDVKCRADALRMFEETGCDAIMIGRAAIGNPWVFAEILDENHQKPTPAERGEAAMRHMHMLCELMGERLSLLNMRTILAWYGKGFRGVHGFMRNAHGASSIGELKGMIEDFFIDGPSPAS